MSNIIDNCDFELIDNACLMQLFHCPINDYLELSGTIIKNDNQFFVQGYDIVFTNKYFDDVESCSLNKALSNESEVIQNNFYKVKDIVKDMQDDGQYVAIIETNHEPTRSEIVCGLMVQIEKILEI